MQDVRVYKGVAKYKGGFDVPKPYTPVGIESWRQVSDTCKNNFCTMNPLNHNNGTFANGNLTTSEPAANGAQIYATMGSNTGKWYYEAHVEDVGTPNTGGTLIGINPLIRPSSNQQNRTAYRSSGDIYNDSSGNSELLLMLMLLVILLVLHGMLITKGYGLLKMEHEGNLEVEILQEILIPM